MSNQLNCRTTSVSIWAVRAGVLLLFLCFLQETRAQDTIRYHNDPTRSLIRLDLAQADGQSLILPLCGPDTLDNPWRIARCHWDSSTGKLAETGLPLAEGLRNIHSFFYDNQFGRSAVIYEKDTMPGHGEVQTASFIDFSDPAKASVKVSSFCYTSFDAMGYVGYRDNAGQSHYVKYNGTELALPPPPQPNFVVLALDKFSDSGLAVVRSNLGYLLYDARSNSYVSVIYPDDLWSFQPDVYVAKSGLQHTVIRVQSTGPRTVDSTLKAAMQPRQIDGQHPVLFLPVNNVSTLVVNATRIIALPDFDAARGDEVLGYEFASRVLVRYRHPAPTRQVFVALDLVNADTKPDTVLTRPSGSRESITPFFGHYFLVEQPRDNFALVLASKFEEKHVLTTARSWRVFRIQDSLSKTASFFFVANDFDGFTKTLLLRFPSKADPGISLLDRCRCSDSVAFAGFFNNILAIRDDAIAVGEQTVRGWKFLDGHKACHRATNQAIGRDEKIMLDQKKLFWSDLTGIVFPPYQLTTIPLPPPKGYRAQKLMVYYDGKNGFNTLIIDYKRQVRRLPM